MFHEGVFPFKHNPGEGNNTEEILVESNLGLHPKTGYEEDSWIAQLEVSPIDRGSDSTKQPLVQPTESSFLSTRLGTGPSTAQPQGSNAEPCSAADLNRIGLDLEGSSSDNRITGLSPESESGPPARPSQTVTVNKEPKRGNRVRRTSAHFGEYLCYNVRSNNLVSLTTPLQKASSGMSYPLKDYVTCTNFSTSHQQFLAAITKIAEPRFYHEVVQNEHWRKATTEEIKALEKMRLGPSSLFRLERKLLAANEFIRSSTNPMAPLKDIKHVW